jgi:hypothetical protein
MVVETEAKVKGMVVMTNIWQMQVWARPMSKMMMMQPSTYLMKLM